MSIMFILLSAYSFSVNLRFCVLYFYAGENRENVCNEHSIPYMEILRTNTNNPKLDIEFFGNG